MPVIEIAPFAVPITRTWGNPWFPHEPPPSPYCSDTDSSAPAGHSPAPPAMGYGNSFSSLFHCERQRSAGGELPFDRRPRLALADRATHLLERALELKLVARLDDPLEAGVVDARKESDPAAVFLLREDGNRARLSHRLDDQHAGHHRPAGEVAAEEPLVPAHALEGD